MDRLLTRFNRKRLITFVVSANGPATKLRSKAEELGLEQESERLEDRAAP